MQVEAVGHWLPDRVRSNAEVEQHFDTTDRWIRAHLGIEQRRIAEPDQLASDLACRALQRACRQAEVDISELDLLICGTWTPDHLNPPLATDVLRKAGLSVPGFDIHSGGCAGGVVALVTAAQFVATSAAERVAVVLADVNTHMVDPQDRTAAAIFGDGAGCYLLSAAPPGHGIAGFALRTDADGRDAAWVPAGGRALPASARTVEQGLHWFSMDGPAVKAFATQEVPKLAVELLGEHGLTPEDVDLVICHQANLRIVEGIMETLGLAMDRTFTTVQRYGNTAGASIPITLSEAVREGRVARGDTVLLLAFGAGLNTAAALLRW